MEAPGYDKVCFTQNTAQGIELMPPASRLPPGAAILNVRCGTGRHSLELARKGFSVTGLALFRRHAGPGRPIELDELELRVVADKDAGYSA